MPAGAASMEPSPSAVEPGPYVDIVEAIKHLYFAKFYLRGGDLPEIGSHAPAIQIVIQLIDAQDGDALELGKIGRRRVGGPRAGGGQIHLIEEDIDGRPRLGVLQLAHGVLGLAQP